MSKAPAAALSADPFEGLRRRLSGKTDSASLAKAIEDVAAVKSNLQERHAALSQARADSLLTATPAELAASRAELGALADALDVAAAFRSRLTADHTAALAAEEDARRTEAYTAAKAKADAARKALATEYPRAVAGLLGLVGMLGEAQAAVHAANVALPRDAVPIDDPETMARTVPGAPRKVLASKAVRGWVSVDVVDSRHDGSTRPVKAEPVDDVTAKAIKSTVGGFGKIGGSAGSPDRLFRMADVRRVEYVAEIPAAHALPLAEYLRLPNGIGGGLAIGTMPPMNGTPWNTQANLAAAAIAAELRYAEPLAPPKAPAPVVAWEFVAFVEDPAALSLVAAE